ncbi:heme-binding protein 2 [Phtheirospermum japonicum]|uniref:Heme-binding protein 2 n=1 Tax=Phtheirospermum japonicum TaxID=374723 RepID=A0A830C918_9LAMI|nr:heme-binding protein 2 [Phtheirospermum japonicum]
MGSPRILILGITKFFLTVSVIFITEKAECKALESPEYTVVHSESEFEVRFYRDSAWMTAPTDLISFEKATKYGFHRLFQYIEGANLNFSRISMAKPVLTSIVPGAGPLHSSSYFVKLYLPVKFQADPPVPLPELNLRLRKFSGFARDNNIVKEAEKLAVSLSRSKWANSTSTQSGYAYSIAQYNSPFKFIARVNEVWVGVSGSEKNGCKPNNLLAAY